MLATLIFFCCTACGPQVIQGRPPFVSIAGMSLAGESLSADFRIANQNGVPMTIEAIELTISADNSDVLRERRALQLAIDANSTEEVHAESRPGAYVREQLSALESGARASLPFMLQGRVRTVENGYLSFEHKGHMYPVPGKPGHYRSAVTQAEGLRRERDL